MPQLPETTLLLIDTHKLLYTPVSSDLFDEYRDGSHTYISRYGYVWLKNGKTHRDGDKPAYIGASGTLRWYQNGQWHRDGDKPAIIFPTGSLEWWQNGKRHRDEDKPAVIQSNRKLQWFQNGKRHRLRGPAVIYLNGTLTWYINGENITDEVNAWLAGEEWHGTPEQVVEFQLRFV